MKLEIERRLEELKQEQQKGQERLAILNQEFNDLNGTMLRISGAIQVMEELIGDKESPKEISIADDLDPTTATKN